MTVDNVNAIISRAATDPDFQHKFFTNFDQAVAGYELTNQEKGILRTLTYARLNAMVLKLQEWGEPPGTASLELMRFLFGDKAGQVIEKKQRPRSNRKLLVAVGVVVLLAALAVSALIVFGAGPNGSGGGATQGSGGSIDLSGGGGSCPCSCVEEQRGSAAITICTDCDGNRCRPGD